MEHDQITETAERLLEARMHRAQIPAPALASCADAYAVQVEIARRSGGLANWKIALAPSGEKIFAPILADTVVEGSTRFPPSHFTMIGVEGEVALRLDMPIAATGPALDRAAVAEIIGDVRAAIEIVDTRLIDWNEAPVLARIADNSLSGALVLGEQFGDWRGMDLAEPGFGLQINGRMVAEPGRNRGGDVMDALVALIDHCRAQRIDLPARSWVSTGSSTGLNFVSEGDCVALVNGGRIIAEAQF